MFQFYQFNSGAASRDCVHQRDSALNRPDTTKTDCQQQHCRGSWKGAGKVAMTICRHVIPGQVMRSRLPGLRCTACQGILFLFTTSCIHSESCTLLTCCQHPSLASLPWAHPSLWGSREPHPVFASQTFQFFTLIHRRAPVSTGKASSLPL